MATLYIFSYSLMVLVVALSELLLFHKLYKLPCFVLYLCKRVRLTSLFLLLTILLIFVLLGKHVNEYRLN